MARVSDEYSWVAIQRGRGRFVQHGEDGEPLDNQSCALELNERDSYISTLHRDRDAQQEKLRNARRELAEAQAFAESAGAEAYSSEIHVLSIGQACAYLIDDAYQNEPEGEWHYRAHWAVLEGGRKFDVMVAKRDRDEPNIDWVLRVERELAEAREEIERLRYPCPKGDFCRWRDEVVPEMQAEIERLRGQRDRLAKSVEHLQGCDFPDEVDFRCDGCNEARAALASLEEK